MVLLNTYRKLLTLNMKQQRKWKERNKGVEKGIKELKEKNTDLKDKMYHYRRSCEKLNEKLKSADKVREELEGKIHTMQMERTIQ